MEPKRTAQIAAAEPSRLVQLLSGLSQASPRAPLACVVTRLSPLFGISDAITLDGALRRRPGKHAPAQVCADTLQHDVLEARQAMIRAMAESFQPEVLPGRVILPRPKPDATAEAVGAWNPYLLFYQAQQRQMATMVRNLRVSVREALATHSPAMAQLASLDAAVDDPLAAHTRQCFSRVPALLRRRFDLLQEAAPDLTVATALAADGWLTQFSRDLQAVLVAELDARLEPVVGLVEALNQEVNKVA
ncbi:MAG: DUF3348 domain-containing protein [Marinobacter sp.]|nr:DUF3348 domain-containing protein [Marinobacter sp.]